MKLNEVYIVIIAIDATKIRSIKQNLVYCILNKAIKSVGLRVIHFFAILKNENYFIFKKKTFFIFENNEK